MWVGLVVRFEVWRPSKARPVITCRHGLELINESCLPLRWHRYLLAESTNLLSVLFYVVSSLTIMGCGSSRAGKVIQPSLVPGSNVEEDKEEEGEKSTETHGL